MSTDDRAVEPGDRQRALRPDALPDRAPPGYPLRRPRNKPGAPRPGDRAHVIRSTFSEYDAEDRLVTVSSTNVSGPESVVPDDPEAWMAERSETLRSELEAQEDARWAAQERDAEVADHNERVRAERAARLAAMEVPR